MSGEAILISFVLFGASMVATRLLTDEPEIGSFEFEESGVKVNTVDTQEFIPVVYGKAKVGGNDIYRGISGTDNKDIWFAQTLAEGKCASLATDGDGDLIYLGDKRITDYGSYAATTFYTGATDQAVDTDLEEQFSDWEHPVKNTCYMVWKFSFDRDYFISVPKRTVVLKGIEVYDFRDTTTAWSDNPVLCLYDYLTNARYGLGIDTSKIDTTSWTSSANYCDTARSNEGWHLNLEITSDMSSRDVINTISQAFRGQLVWFDGKFYLRYADLGSESSVMTIEDKHIVQDDSGKAVVSLMQPSGFRKPDCLTVKFTDPNKDWTLDDLPIGDEEGYKREITLRGCADRQEAADMGIYRLERLQLDRQISGLFRDDCCQLEPYDIVIFNSTALNIADQYLRVVESNLQPDGLISLTFQYESTDIYDVHDNLNVENEYTTTLPDPLAQPPDVTNVRVTEQTYDYRLRTLTRLHVDFDHPSNYAWFDYAEIWQVKQPIAFWKFDDGTGTIARDDGRYNENGTLVGDAGVPAWGTGIASGCLSFTRASDHGVTITPTSNYPLNDFGNGSWAIAAWIKNTSPATEGFKAIFTKYQDADNTINISDQWSATHKLRVLIEKDTEAFYAVFDDTYSYATDDNFKLIVISCDMVSKEISVWQNTTKSNETIVLVTATTTDFSNTGDCCIGNRSSGTWGFNGDIDEVMLFNVPLNQKDVEFLYSTPGGNTKQHLFNTTSDFNIDPVEEGEQYKYIIRPVNIWGVKRTLNSSYSLLRTVSGKAEAVPSSLTKLNAIVNQNAINLYADKVSDPDIELYEFRLGSSWSGGIFLYSSRSPNLSLFGVKPGTHSFFVNTLGTNSVYGANPQSETVALQSPPDGWSVYFTSYCTYATGTFDNTEQYEYVPGEMYLKCSHTAGSLSGSFTSEIYSFATNTRFLVYAFADIVVTGVGTTWDDAIPLTLTGSTLVIDGAFDNWTTGDLDDWLETTCDATEASGQTGNCAVIATSATDGYISQEIAVTGSKWYLLDMYYRNATDSVGRMGVYDITNSDWVTPDGLINVPDQVDTFDQHKYLFVAPATCATVSICFGAYASGATCAFDTVILTEIDTVNSTSWEDINIGSRNWAQIFELTEGPSVTMTLHYGTGATPTDTVEKLEILSAIVTAKSYQLEINITDPSSSITALIENFELNFCTKD